MVAISQVQVTDSGAAKKGLDNEVSDSNSSGSVIQAPKRQKLDNNTASSSFKGVVLQQNGHWGAQTYADHRRIWLGTSKSKAEAAMAYDSTAIKSHSRELHRNIPWTNITIQEPSFQSQFSTATVINTIKGGSNTSKFLDHLNEQFHADPDLLSPKGEGFFCKKLFHKELTPSDVGKLNRLVIPKKYAVMHFLGSPKDEQENENNAGDTEIVCYDRFNTEWKFRLCYWKSSQSYVFTRGWNGFVKAKHLSAKDTVYFFSCERKGGPREISPAFMIDVEFYHWSKGDRLECSLEKDKHLLHTLEEENDLLHAVEKLKDLQHRDSIGSTSPRLRLFGVQIV